SVTLVAGLLVLAGAVAAGQRRRIYDAVILKVLGGRRRDIVKAFLLEFGLIGLLAAILAVLFGSLAAWAVLTNVMRVESFTFLFLPVALTVLLAIAVTLLFGFGGTWRALQQKAAPLLRNDYTRLASCSGKTQSKRLKPSPPLEDITAGQTGFC